MSARGTWVEGNGVHMDDVNGWTALIPARRIQGLVDEAMGDEGRARFALRWFDRDALIGARDLLNLCDQCHDQPASEDMGDGKTFCPGCCSSAAGSKYDDREDYS